MPNDYNEKPVLVSNYERLNQELAHIYAKIADIRTNPKIPEQDRRKTIDDLDLQAENIQVELSMDVYIPLENEMEALARQCAKKRTKKSKSKK